MDRETFNLILDHLGDMEFCRFLFDEVRRNSTNDAEDKKFAALLKNAFDDINNYKTTSQDKLSDDTFTFINSNSSLILRILSFYEKDKLRKSENIMNNLTSKINSEIVIQYWQDSQRKQVKINLKDVKDYERLMLGDGTVTIPFFDKKIAIYKIIDSNTGEELYVNPKVETGFDVENPDIIAKAQNEMFGMGYADVQRKLQQKKSGGSKTTPQPKPAQPTPQPQNGQPNPDKCKCPYCDAENEIENAFCNNCGATLELSTIYANEYFEARIKEIDEKIKELEETIKNSETPEKEQYIELATYRALKDLIINNRNEFMAHISDYVKKGTLERDDDYKKEIRNIDAVTAQIAAETKDRKKARDESRKANMITKAGMIKDKQRTVVNEGLKKAYDKMFARAQKLGKQDGTNALYEEQMDILEDQINQINDDLSDKKIKGAIQQLQILVLNIRIDNLKRKQGKIVDAKAKNNPDDDVIKFKI